MLAKETNEKLTRVGPGTPMGELMRRYWHPIAASQELADSPFRTKGVRLLGEDLVLFRDRSGKLGLIERFCPHRRVDLAIGVVEENGLRCQYHGWKFDSAGTCLEQPFEDTTHPEDNFRAKCGIAGYAVQELAGLVFAYLGPQPAPLLPRWEPLTWDNAVRDIAITTLPCNWLQAQENSVDPVHTEWLHNYFGNYVADMKRDESNSSTTRRHLRQKAPPDRVRRVPVRHHQAAHGRRRHWRRRRLESRSSDPVPQRSTDRVASTPTRCSSARRSTTRTPITCRSTSTRPLQDSRRRSRASSPIAACPLIDGDGNWVLNYTFNQDYMAWVTQGDIAQRDKEKLGASDRGVILFRQMLQEQMERVREGEEPMNTFRDAAANRVLSFPMERVKHAMTKRPTYRPGEAGFSADAELIKATLATWDHTEFAAEP